MSKLLVLALLVASVFAWGPFSHQSFACKQLGAQNCSASTSDRSFILGASAPDAMKSWKPELHDWGFAARQYHYSLNVPATDAFDPTAFALGYGAHLAMDYAGHHQNGYLNPAKDHELEFAADSYCVKNYIPFTGTVEAFYPALFSAEARQFWVPALQELTGTTDPAPIQAALDNFDKTLVEEAIAASLNFLYKQMMTNDDFCHAATFDEATRHFTTSAGWSVEAGRVWGKTISSDSTDDGALARGNTQKWVDNVFVQCGGSICNNPTLSA
eukprot:GAFH01003145.1.p1 GENE.GAFH01003145.1~~GAFH01003145.1.p1  ORF type:complete len:271 (-),score=29.03 GAFH01003145.1:152-964(-)